MKSNQADIDIADYLADVNAIRPEERGADGILRAKYNRSDLKVAKVLCTADGFAVCELKNGCFIAIWKAHAHVCQTLEELRELLNVQEKRVLQCAAKRGTQ